MKTRIIITRFLTVLLVMLIAVSTSAQTKSKKPAKTPKKPKTETVQLFNGKDLSNWTFKLRDASVDPMKVFSVQNGVIRITGDPFGYMRTKDVYSDYTLHVEWRYPGEASNSGVFVHAQLPDTIWLKCFECQLQAGNAGDFVCMGGANMNEQSDKSKRVVKKMAASSEKPVGEWNTMEVICKASTIEVFVNSVLQNRATGISDSKGHICLQSEGKNIEFRNVFLTKLKR
jgi:hypothetical protein